MKYLKLLALAFVFGITSSFAISTDLPDVPVKQSSLNTSEFDTAPVEDLFDIRSTNKVRKTNSNIYSNKNNLNKKQAVNKNNTDIIQIVNNYDNMNSKNSQVRQIRNYSYKMSDIMKKE